VWLFLDLSKVLDTVNHSRLLLKLKSIGFSSHVCEWFKSYLTHRCQVTVVDNKQSSGKPMNIGVPQGSILRPLLFIIYVNELPNCITSCDISMYADDTVIYFSSKSVKNIEGKLNEGLANVQKWFTDNLLTLNEKKSKFMLIGG
jgi:retron-type reverse transcriptase